MTINNEEECSFCALEIFKRPVIQSDILNGKLEKIYSITKLEDSGLIEFPIENMTNHFFDFWQNCLNIKFQMVNSDGSNLVTDGKAGIVNYASLFQQVDVLLNGNLISISTSTYAYRAMLDILLGYDQGAKSSCQWMVLKLDSKQQRKQIERQQVDRSVWSIALRSCIWSIAL